MEFWFRPTQRRTLENFVCVSWGVILKENRGSRLAIFFLLKNKNFYLWCFYLSWDGDFFISSYVILWNKQENVFLADKFARTNCVVTVKTRSIMLQQLFHKTVLSSRNSWTHLDLISMDSTGSYFIQRTLSGIWKIC